jgi:hypothetical protein
MRRTFLAATCCTLAAGLAGPAESAPPSPQIVDPEGDANYLAADFFTPPPPSTAPASVDTRDILSVRWSTAYARDRRTPRALLVTMTLKADVPKPGAVGSQLLGYSASGMAYGDCQMYLAYILTMPPNGNGASTTLEICETPGVLGFRYVEIPPATVAGNTITWTIPLDRVERVGLKRGAPIIHLFGSSRSGRGWPVSDYASSEVTFRV